MKSKRYRQDMERLVAVAVLLFMAASLGIAEDRTEAVPQFASSDSVTNTGKAFRYDPNGPNPFSGLSEKELWDNKPKMRPIGWPPKNEEEARIYQWAQALEKTASNPYRGKSARQLQNMKPKMRKVGPWPPENEGEYRIWQWWHAIRKADPDQEWKMPIEFYGIVVNQSNQPLPGVSVSVIPSMVDGTTPKLSMETDMNGRFSVTNIFGKLIDVLVGKIGYRSFSSAHQGFEYFDITLLHTPDPTNPVVFRLWEYVNPEPMYHPNVRKGTLSVDDKSIWVDVQNGNITNSGQVGFSVLRVDPTNLTAGYTMTIHSAKDGGVRLADSDDELLFQAPENGYQPKIRIEQAPGEKCWQGTQLRFYLRTPDEKYAAIGIDVRQRNNGTADLETWVRFNPSGSRNLQYRDDLLLRDKKK